MLNDIVVLDLSRYFPGPFATSFLGNLGAQVIKVEEPTAGDPVRQTGPFKDGTSILFEQLNHNKRSITLNLKNASAKSVFDRLVRRADILVESFRPGVTKRLRIDYPSLKAENPRLIYCSISGYGQDGPDRELAGHDLTYIARSGLLSLNADAQGNPVIPPIQVADFAGGAMMALAGILTSLYAREKSGCGNYIDISMLDGTLALLPVAFASLGASNAPTIGEKTELTGQLPFYNIYRTADGRFMSLAAMEPKFWQNFCNLIGRSDLIPKQFASGWDRHLVFEELRKIFLSRSQHDWHQTFAGQEVCCEPVNSLSDVVNNPQVQHRGMIRKSSSPDSALYLANPLRLSDFQETPWRPAPAHGEHTEEILRELDYSESQISDLKSQKAI